MILILERAVEFFERTLNFKIKKGQLIAALIIVELTGILVLVWYLRVPLYQKYLTVSPRTYNVGKFLPNQKYLLTQGDFVIGNTIANNQVIALIRQEEDLNKKTKFRAAVSSDGSWNLRVPVDLKPGSYRLTVGIFGSNNSSVSISTYKIRILSRNIFKNDRSLKEFLANFANNSSSSSVSGSLADPADILEINQSVGNTSVPLEQSQSSVRLPQSPAKPLLDN